MKTIKLGNSQLLAIVDDDDFEWLSKWHWTLCKRSNMIVRAETHGGKTKMFSMHRQVMHAPKGIQVDHIHHNRLDNRKSELRFVTQRQNSANMNPFARKGANSTSRYKGVMWDKSRSLWVARIKVNYNMLHLGRYQMEVDAARAYNAAAIKFFGSFACLNPV